MPPTKQGISRLYGGIHIAPDDFEGTLASEAGRRGLSYEAVYFASKFGQVGFTRALDHELREHGVRCTSVCPGGVAVLTRPGRHRILETAFRPMSEGSWG